ncbi:hypothetical protein WH87_08495 [Devosia epidermidihirudinis]|uniref:Uncharacterized protein n=1 Tax=Devosia epidermidihirudinis TaxID=1293439 RepID=A0A0F5Q9T5_9HYPH|nr:hypothetical protein [Devosia epidermidihirudinis]KKC37742.1 hypothetical protein WH87_08495 [Devosia epidermidihirudinis]
MWLVVAALLSSGGWFLFRRWRRTIPTDPRLTMAYWRNSGLVLGAYLLSILLGAGVTRIMVGFNRGGWADLLMVAFFIVWVGYGAVWMLRYLPTTKPQPAWLTRPRGWLDAVALLALAGLATGARML